MRTKSDGTKSVSLYVADNLSDVGIAKNLKKLQIAFPKQSVEFFNVLAERLIANGFTDERIKDAVNHIIDSFQYKELNISDIIKFDKRIKLYSHSDICNEIHNNRVSFSDFEKYKKVGKKQFWVKKADLV